LDREKMVHGNPCHRLYRDYHQYHFIGMLLAMTMLARQCALAIQHSIQPVCTEGEPRVHP
jgi:uncharacterized membrane-anchored protein